MKINTRPAGLMTHNVQSMSDKEKLMNVSELINKLKSMPKDLVVVICDGYGGTSPLESIGHDGGILFLYTEGELNYGTDERLPPIEKLPFD